MINSYTFASQKLNVKEEHFLIKRHYVSDKRTKGSYLREIR